MPRRQESPLRPIHSSVSGRLSMLRGHSLHPTGMSRLAMADEQRQCVESIALGIFTDMTNAGATLQQTLAAVYLSGAEHATTVQQHDGGAKP